MRNLLLISFFLLSFLGFAQEDAWVYFADKPNSQTYLDNPLTMLTQRALDRRAAQNIALDIRDVPIEQTYIDQIINANGITVMAKSKWLNCLHIRGSFTDIDALTNLSFVDHVHYADNSLNSRSIHPHTIIPVNKQLDVNTNYNYGTSYNQTHMMNVDWLHQQGYTGSGKIIAVLDAGFPGVDTAQPFQNLISTGAILGGYDYVHDDSNFYTSFYHGTEVLSTMGGFKDGQLVGTAPDAQYYLYITEDVSSENPVEESYWVEATEEADRLGVDIITSSLGYFAFDNTAYGHTYSDMTGNTAIASQGANVAFSKGIVVVASAGNAGNSSEPHVGVPAEATNVLAIGAVMPNRNRASFSSVGPSFDGRIKPDVMAQGQQSIVSDVSGNIVSNNGTSFSGPILAGSIASFWSAFPNLTNQEVVDFVKQSADRFSNPDNQYGYGIPDFQVAVNEVLLNTKNVVSNSFMVFPNPTQNNFNVIIPNSINEVNLHLYNALGQEVLSKLISKNNPTVSLENLNPGVFLYKMESNLIYQTGKIIKN